MVMVMVTTMTGCARGLGLQFLFLKFSKLRLGSVAFDKQGMFRSGLRTLSYPWGYVGRR